VPDRSIPPAGAGDCSHHAEQDLRGALHDVANALTVVLGWLEAAARDGDERSLTIAREWARHGRGIALRAIGATRALDAESPGDLTSLIQHACAGAEPQAKEKGVSILTALSGDGAAALRAWPLALQVVTNIMLNAVAFSPPGTHVRVEASGDRGAIRVVITDEGPGLDPTLRDRLFDGVPSSRPGGSGIGLRHSRALALAQGGNVRALESDKGAAFEVTWPVTGATPRPSSMRAKRVSLAGRRVIVFDDDAAVLALLQTGLEGRGAEVATARDVEGLRAIVGTGEYDAALIDLSPMADEAEQALVSMRAANPEMRVVLISGSSVPPPREAMAMACAWIRKPFEMGEIVSAILGE
jgi:CheY-like chemotaxis protein